MKKIILGTLLLASFFSNAQIDFRSTRFGIVAGGTYSGVRNAHNPSGVRYSVLGGITTQTSIDAYDQFYIQAEVLYFGAGEGGDRKYEKSKGKPHAVYANNYISVPLNFKGYFSEAASEFFGIIGPRFNFLVNQQIKNPAKDSYKIDTYGKANSFNMGIGLGIGYSYKRKLEVALKYDMGLSDAYPELKYSPEEVATEDPNVAKNKSEQTISLGLTYFFN